MEETDQTGTTSEEKAWKYLKSIVQNQEVYQALRNGLSVELVGSEGGKYFLYPSGRIVSIDAKAPKLGEFRDEYEELPQPDILASAYLWITKNEEGLIENWGCGKIAVESEEGRERREALRRELRRGTASYIRRRRHRSFWEENTTFIIALIIIIPVSFVVISTVMPQMQTIFESLQSSNSISSTPETLSPIINVFMILLPFIMMLSVLKLLAKDW